MPTHGSGGFGKFTRAHYKLLTATDPFKVLLFATADQRSRNENKQMLALQGRPIYHVVIAELRCISQL